MKVSANSPPWHRRARRAALALLVTVCAVAPPIATAAAGPPRTVRVQALAALDRAFGAYADRGGAPGHWTGGDSTYSVPTAAGELWVFSDTFLGTVRPDGSRSPVTADGGSTPFVHNSFVLWKAAGPHTVTGRDAAGRATSVVPESGDGWYWARAGLPNGRGADIVYARYARSGPGPLDVSRRGSVLASFRTGRFEHPDALGPVPSAAGISWGAWLQARADGSGGAYAYGTEPAPDGGNYLHLARTCGPGLHGRWQYRAADGSWSADERRSARLTVSGGPALRTSDEVSVVRHGRWYALLTQRADRPFSPELQLAWSPGPAGPFTPPRTVYTAPEAGPSGTYHNGNVIAYNPHEHPELERPGELLASYNVNSLAPPDVIRRADIYRPRFIRIALASPEP